MGAAITAVLGDITTQRVDVIVNAANRAMRGGGGVDGAIHAAGGPDILADCIRRFPQGLDTGQAGWTTAGRLPARFVVHVVGPNYRAGERDPELLSACYRNALTVSAKLGAATVAFPLVSAGIFGWPLHDAAARAVAAVRAGVDEHPLEEVRFVLFNDEAHRAVTAALAPRA